MTRRRTLVAALTAAALTSCSLDLDAPPTTPAPPTRIAAPPTTITAPPTGPQTQTQVSSTAFATATVDQDLVDDGAPTNKTVLSNPQFTLDTVDLSSPEQVAWAYLTERLSYSYRDAQPGAGVARAARYLTPEAATHAPPPAAGDPAQDTQWAAAVTARTVASTTVTRLTTFHPDSAAVGTEALVVADWTRVLFSDTGRPLWQAGSVTLTVFKQSDSTWRVGDSSFGTAG